MIVFALACTPEIPEQPEPPALVDIEIEPDHVVLTTGLAVPDPVQFVATGEYDDGSIAALDTVEWSLSNRSVGTLDELGLFTPSADNGGFSYISARLAGIEDDGQITLTWLDEINDEAVDTALFESGVVSESTFWLYPEDGVNFPRNTPSIRFMWSPVEGAAAYRLRLSSDVTDLSVYTTGTSWTADVASWQQIVATNAGGSVDVELEASVAGTVVANPARTLHVNRMDAEGSIVYWTTTNSGLMEIPYGGEASEFLTVNQTGRCVGCHVISSQDRIAFTYDGGNGPMGVKHVDDLSDVTTETIYGNFKAFSPDGEWLVSTLNGALLLFDGVTGESLGEIALSQNVTMPTWSPDGDRIVVVTTTDHGADWTFAGGQLGVIDVNGDGTFSDVTWLYTPGQSNVCYPEFSPDGRWLIFNESNEDCYDDTGATLMAMDAEGGTPIELVNANMAADLTNSWPRWGPLPDDDVLWLTFSSKRAYGDIVSGNPQIWVAGFDPARAEDGEDPSWPAFWLPGQATSDNNHIPVWAP